MKFKLTHKSRQNKDDNYFSKDFDKYSTEYK